MSDSFELSEVVFSAGWQSVKSMPKDGSLVLVWVSACRYQEDDEGRVHEQDCSQIDFASWRRPAEAGPGGGWPDPCCGTIGDCQAVTHWMPLPQPPKG